jgi:hypothetical protein
MAQRARAHTQNAHNISSLSHDTTQQHVPGTGMASGAYTASLRANCARSMSVKMIVSSCRMSDDRMLSSDSAELMSSAADACSCGCRCDEDDDEAAAAAAA